MIKEQEQQRPLWDLDENQGTETWYDDLTQTYVRINTLGKSTLKRQKIQLLFFLDEFTKEIQKVMRYRLQHGIMNNNNYVNDDMMYVFCTTPHYFMEIPSNKNFLGINKPKNVRYHNNATCIGKDTKHRAEYRIVMLYMDNFDKLKNVRDLYTHELAHTLANHVIFHNDDHHYDFQECEAYLKQIINDELEFSKRIKPLLIII